MSQGQHAFHTHGSAPHLKVPGRCDRSPQEYGHSPTPQSSHTHNKFYLAVPFAFKLAGKSIVHALHFPPHSSCCHLSLLCSGFTSFMEFSKRQGLRFSVCLINSSVISYQEFLSFFFFFFAGGGASAYWTLIIL